MRCDKYNLFSSHDNPKVSLNDLHVTLAREEVYGDGSYKIFLVVELLPGDVANNEIIFTESPK